MSGAEFPESVRHYSSEELDHLAQNFQTLTNQRWVDVGNFEAELMGYIRSTSGVLSLMIDQNPELYPLVLNFLTGRSPALAIVGSSGHGKSLLATDLRGCYELYVTLTHTSDPLAFLPWDKQRNDFYLALREAAGVDLNQELPKRVADQSVTQLISEGLRHVATTIRSDHPNARLLIETPGFRSRGEAAIHALTRIGTDVQVATVYSPETREYIMQKGKRDVATSAPVGIMQQMQEELFHLTVGPNVTKSDRKREDDLVGGFFRNRFHGYQGTVVRWNPYLNFDRFKQTEDDFIQRATQPDSLSPQPIAALIRPYFEARLKNMPPAQLEDLFDKTIK